MVLEETYFLRLTYFVSVLFGTWPIFLSNQVRLWLKRYSMYTIWLLIATTGQIYYVFQPGSFHPKTSTTLEYSKYNAINKKLVLAEDWAFSLTTLLNMLATYVNSRHIPGVMQIFADTSKWLDRVATPEEMKTLRRNEFLRSLFWFVASYSAIVLTMAVEYSGLISIQRETNFLNILFQDMGKLSMMTFDLQFATISIHLSTLFEGVNTILNSIRKTYDAQRNRVNLPYYSQDSSTNEILGSMKHPEIHELNSVHRTLCNCVERVSQIYQIQIAFNAFVCFFNTVCVLFTTISQYRSNTDWTLWISGVLWVTFYVIRVIMVCISAASVIEQAYESKKHLTYIDDRGLNERQKFQVEHFLQRLSNTDIRFKLCGLMTVDKSFLSSACLGIVTYLVIALQYSYT